jgi:two-component system invasion response regulator UvrY
MTRVLVIDDHPIVLQGCRQLLEDAGVEQIVQAQSLADGFRLYRAQKPDVIIVDLAMRTGALGGLSFIRRLRLHDQKTPILVFTMHSDPVIVSRALEVGVTGLRAQGHLSRRGGESLSAGAREPSLSQPRPCV